MTLREIQEALKKTYCKFLIKQGGSIGIEYGHIPDRHACEWLRSKFEVPLKYNYTKEQKKVILDRLMWSDHFERFVAAKYPSEKRFGLEGAESLVPGMKALIDWCVELGATSVVMGMPHRGRLNVLSNVVRKPHASIFSEFSGTLDNSVEGSGDVKYHLGMVFNIDLELCKTYSLWKDCQFIIDCQSFTLGSSGSCRAWQSSRFAVLSK